ncbi:MAG: hypothetical protein JST06_08165 [Bacteroidetes bacterium]|nr:hypothetical protein [Bacteroidota bacterium]MBS1628452.1 hypothetical protein [Bacteroidota bacterium]
MKKLLLIATLLCVSSGFTFAQTVSNTANKAAEIAQIDKAVATSKSELSKKASKLEHQLNNNSSKAQETAEEVYKMLLDGMNLTRKQLNATLPGGRGAVNEKYLALEMATNNFRLNKEDALSHKTELLKAVQNYQARY